MLGQLDVGGIRRRKTVDIASQRRLERLCEVDRELLEALQ